MRGAGTAQPPQFDDSCGYDSEVPSDFDDDYAANMAAKRGAFAHQFEHAHQAALYAASLMRHMGPPTTNAGVRLSQPAPAHGLLFPFFGLFRFGMPSSVGVGGRSLSRCVHPSVPYQLLRAQPHTILQHRPTPETAALSDPEASTVSPRPASHARTAAALASTRPISYAPTIRRKPLSLRR